jgi:bifunctional non-homologous end joining protein LigD
MLNYDRSVPVRLMIFDVLRIDGDNTAVLPYAKRRALLEQLDLNGSHWSTPDVFDDGDALYTAVCERGLEGVVAKWRRSSYRSGVRGWIKTKNPSYWRRQPEIDAVRRTVERKAVRA